MTQADFDVVTTVLAAAAWVAGAAVVRMSARPRGAPVQAGHLVRAATVALAVAFFGSWLGQASGYRTFGVIRIVYVALVVVVPLLGAALLAARFAGRIAATRGALVLAAATALPAGVGVWATWIEPFRIVVERTTVPIAPDRGGHGRVRVGVLADLQTDAVGAHEHLAVDLLLAERPDVILVPGDLFQGWPDEYEPERENLRALLARLDAPGGVYFVRGDTDSVGETRALLEGTRVRYLFDEVVRVRVNDRVLAIGGISSSVRTAQLGPDAAAVVRDLERAEGDEIRILMAHPPDVAFAVAPATRIDLLVAGHTHGGQIVVPFFGPPLTLSRVPRRVAAGGLHDLDGRRIYVSRGVGVERIEAPRMRFLCPPEISILDLE